MSWLFNKRRRARYALLAEARGPLLGIAVPWSGFTLLAACCYFITPSVLAQAKKPASPSAFGSANGEFVAAENDNGKIRSVIKGVGATLETEGAGKARVERIRLKQVRLEQYGDDGRTNMIVEGRNCLFDPKTRAASSPDSFRLTTGGGRLVVEGIGFSWYHTNSHLVVSNRVHTVVSGTDALFSPSKSP